MSQNSQSATLTRYDDARALSSVQTKAVPRRGAWSYTVLADTYRSVSVLLAALASVTVIMLGSQSLGLDGDVTGRFLALLPVFCILMHLAMPMTGKNRLDILSLSDILKLLLICTGCILISLVAHAAIGFRQFESWPIFSWWLMASFTATALTRVSAAILCNSTAVQRRIRRKIAIYGGGTDAARVHKAIFSEGTAVELVGFFDDRTAASRRDNHRLKLHGALDELLMLTRLGEIDEVVIALPRTAARRIEAIAQRLQEYPVDLHICTHFAADFPILGGASSVSRVGGAGLLQLHCRPIKGWGIVLKKLEDMLLGALFLALLTPVMAVIAIAIKLDSKGPAIFRQKRHGLMNETITVYKFRTMTVEENDSSVAQATRNDPRITRVGAFLRKTSLDEVPQLINVIKGEMSLVGPRPHAIAHNNIYGQMIDRYFGRHMVRPGITGWAQVNGLRGETKDPTLMTERVEHDLWYIENWSLWMDLKIILLTPFRGLIHKNAY